MTEQKKAGAGLRRLGKALLWGAGILCVLAGVVILR